LRILAIGDSFTYGWGVDIEYTWPFLLEKKLSGQYKDKRVEVINLGVGGAVPSEYSEIAEEYILLYKPDFVIVGFVEGNDFAQITTSVEKGKKVISSETTVRRQKLLDELADSNNILDKRIRINNFIRSVFPNIHKLISKRNTIEIRLSFIEKMRKYILQLDDEDIDELNKIIANTDIFSRKIQLSYNEEINRVIVTVVDRDSGEVLREIPSKDLQRLARHLKDAIGVLYDKSF